MSFVEDMKEAVARKKPYNLKVRVSNKTNHYFYDLSLSETFSTIKKFAIDNSDDIDFECFTNPTVVFHFPKE